MDRLFVGRVVQPGKTRVRARTVVVRKEQNIVVAQREPSIVVEAEQAVLGSGGRTAVAVVGHIVHTVAVAHIHIAEAAARTAGVVDRIAGAVHIVAHASSGISTLTVQPAPSIIDRTA